MLNLWDKILSLSGLPECRSIAEHLCKASVGGQTIYIPTDVLMGKMTEQKIISGVVESESIKGTVVSQDVIIGTVSQDIIKGKLTDNETIKGDIRCQ